MQRFFLRDADKHFKAMKIVNFDMIKNYVSEQIKKQYQQINHHEIMCYPSKEREEICSSIFRNVNREGMYVKKETINEHFKSKKVNIGRGRFVKKLRTEYMLRLGDLFVIFLLFIRKKIECLTIRMVLLFYMLSLGIFLFFVA